MRSAEAQIVAWVLEVAQVHVVERQRGLWTVKLPSATALVLATTSQNCPTLLNRQDESI